MKLIQKQIIECSDIFLSVREWCNSGDADKHISAGDQILIPRLEVPAVKDCEGEAFDEIDLKDISVIAVHVEKSRVVFNFEDILFKHDIDSKCSGKPFDETQLGIYLAKHFADALKEYTGDVEVSLLSKENVFDETSKDFMPYFKPIKNRIKVLADENDTWYWWLKTSAGPNLTCFDLIHFSGSRNYDGADDSYCGVAPAFEIKGEAHA